METTMIVLCDQRESLPAIKVIYERVGSTNIPPVGGGTIFLKEPGRFVIIFIIHNINNAILQAYLVLPKIQSCTIHSVGHVSSGMSLHQAVYPWLPKQSQSVPILAITVGSNSVLHQFRTRGEPGEDQGEQTANQQIFRTEA